jgi:hypothetical protein
MFFFFKRKECLLSYFANNIHLLKKWIACSKSTDQGLKKAFLVSLKELLKIKPEDDREAYQEIIRRLFGNINTPNNFPDLGDEVKSAEYLVKQSDTPYEDQELIGLKVLRELIKWDWGMRALYGSSLCVNYLINRAPKGK